MSINTLITLKWVSFCESKQEPKREWYQREVFGARLRREPTKSCALELWNSFFSPLCMLFQKPSTKWDNLHYILVVSRTCFNFINYISTHFHEVFFLCQHTNNKDKFTRLWITNERIVCLCALDCDIESTCWMLDYFIWDCEIEVAYLSLSSILCWRNLRGMHIFLFFCHGDSCSWDQLASSVPTIIRCLELQSTTLSLEKSILLSIQKPLLYVASSMFTHVVRTKNGAGGGNNQRGGM